MVAGCPLGDDRGHGLLHLIGNTEIEARRAGEEATELQRHRIIEAQLLTQSHAVFQGGVLPDHLIDGIADEAKQHERQQRHRQHDDGGLEQPTNCKG